MIKKSVYLASIFILLLSLFLLILFYNAERGITGNLITGDIINSPEFFLEENGLLVIEVEHYNNQTNYDSYYWNFETTNSEYSSDGYMKVLPAGGIFYKDMISNSPELDYIVNFTNSGEYFIWARGQAKSNNSNSFHMGVNGVIQPKTTAINWFFNFSSWEWSNKSEGGFSRVDIASPGVYTVNIWMRESEFSLDKIVFTSDPTFVPQGLGPAETNRIAIVIPCIENWACENWTSCINNTQNGTCNDLNNCGTNITKPIVVNNSCNPTIPANLTIPPINMCIPLWDCTSWGTCLNGNQVRSCLDSNLCGNNTGKPVEMQVCSISPSCTSNWNCTFWKPEKCPKNQTQVRICIDLNHCGVSSGKPIESTTCEYKGFFSGRTVIIMVGVAIIIFLIIALIYLFLDKKDRGEFVQEDVLEEKGEAGLSKY